MVRLMTKSTRGNTRFAPSDLLDWLFTGFRAKIGEGAFPPEGDTDVPPLKIFNTESKSGLQFFGEALIESTKIQMRALSGD